MSERRIVPAGGGAGLRLKRGEQLRIIDIEGGQTGDLVAFSTTVSSASRAAARSTTAERSMCRPAMCCGPTAAARC